MMGIDVKPTTHSYEYEYCYVPRSTGHSIEIPKVTTMQHERIKEQIEQHAMHNNANGQDLSKIPRDTYKK